MSGRYIRRLLPKAVRRLAKAVRRLLRAVLLNELPNKTIDHLYYKVPANDYLIPNSVYQTWQAYTLGRTHLKGLEKFRQLNSDYSFEFFDNERMSSYMKEYYGSTEICEVFDKARFGPLKTDIWRYCILYERGGVYFDINKSVDLPLRELIGKNDRAVISFQQNRVKSSIDWEAPTEIRHRLQHPERIIINWGMAFTKGHPFLCTTIQNIVSEYPKLKMKVVPNVKDAVTRFSGPLMLTRSIWETLQKTPDVDFKQAGIDFYGQGICDMKGSWSRYLSRRSYDEHLESIVVA